MTNNERDEISRIVDAAWRRDQQRQRDMARVIRRNVSTSKPVPPCACRMVAIRVGIYGVSNA